MIVKWLHGDDLKDLESVVHERGWTPIPSSSVALAIFDNKGLAGFHVLQMVPHPEPLWVREDLRSTGLAKELASSMYKFIEETNTTGFMVVADDPVAAKLCELFGMKLVTSPVYML